MKNMRTISNFSTTNSSTNPSSSPPPPSLSPPTTHTLQQQQQQQRSPWQSPVPYLFGGLAAMLGLIAFALLILACSYWRLAGRLDGENGDQERDVENGEESDNSAGTALKVYEEKILVIMAGEEKPTFLATPVSRKATSFGDQKEGEESEQSGKEKTESEEVVKDEGIGSTNHDQTETH